MELIEIAKYVIKNNLIPIVMYVYILTAGIGIGIAIDIIWNDFLGKK